MHLPVEHRPVTARLRFDAHIVSLAVVAEDPVQHLHGQVAGFNPVKELHALDVVVKFPDPVLFAEGGQAGFPEMPVRDVPDVVPDRDCLDEVFV